LLNTNGLLLNDKDLLAFFKQKDFAITVSIDGPQEVNDQNRLLQSGQGSFKHILANIEVLKQAGIKLNLRATISPRNQNLLNTFRFFENLAIPYAYAFTISASEKDEKETKMNQGTWVRTQQEYQQVFDFLTDKLLRKEEVFNMDFKQKLSILNQKTIRTHGCEAGRASFLVDELGRYFACQNMLPYQACIGELENGIVSSIRDRYKSQFVSELKDCQQCWARYLCGGGCQTERIFNASSQSMYCDISRFEWEQILLAHIKSKANKN
jgi:transcriptional regulator